MCESSRNVEPSREGDAPSPETGVHWCIEVEYRDEILFKWEVLADVHDPVPHHMRYLIDLYHCVQSAVTGGYSYNNRVPSAVKFTQEVSIV